MNSVLVETDLIVEYLTAEQGSRPLLRRLLQTATCYATFVQAAEIYSVARDDSERRIVERALLGLKILGASARYAKTIGDVLSSLAPSQDHRTAIVAAMALESKLPIVTDTHYDQLRQVSALRVIAASELRTIPNDETLADALASPR